MKIEDDYKEESSDEEHHKRRREPKRKWKYYDRGTKVCPHCSMQFHGSNLSRHLKRCKENTTTETDIPKYECIPCGYKTGFLETYKTHCRTKSHLYRHGKLPIPEGRQRGRQRKTLGASASIEPKTENNKRARDSKCDKKPSYFIINYMYRSLFGEENGMTDVVIRCSDGSVPVHKLVLASISDMFCSMLSEDTWDEVISVMLPDFEVATVMKYFENLFKYGRSDSIELGTVFRLKGIYLEENVKGEAIEEYVDFEKVNGLEEPKYTDLVENKVNSYDNGFDVGDLDEDYDEIFEGDTVRNTPDVENNFFQDTRINDFVTEHFAKTTDKMFTCKHCGYVVLLLPASNPRKIIDHVLYKHEKLVDQDFKNHFHKEMEKKKPDPATAVQCLLCGKMYKDENVLKAHHRNIHLSEEEKAKRIMKQKLRSERLAMFKKENKGKYIKVSDEKYKKYKYKCTSCDYINQQTKVIQHYNAIHETKEPAPCEICGKMFENLSKHVREVHQKHRPSDSNVKCPKCNRSVTKKRLAFHVCGLNSKCLKCGQGFENDASRNDHMIHEHQMEKEHSCHLCGKMFWTSSGVNKHLEAHKELVECSQCGKKVKHLQRHIAVEHSGEKRYKCQYCEKTFIWKRLLDNHVDCVHLNARRYPCRYGCDFRFNDQSNRITHERKKHGIKRSKSKEKE